MSASIFACPDWFDIRRYARTAALDFEGWQNQIGSRIFLAGLLAANKQEEFDLHFAEIKDSPFTYIDVIYDHASSNAVYPLTFGVADTMVAALKPLSPHRRDDCDKILSNDGQKSFAMQAHLTIDFNASETEIINDFKAWLGPAAAANRTQFPRDRNAGITSAMIGSWNEHQILPYEDLRLWHRRQGLAMPSGTILVHWLFPDSDAGKDKARDTISKAESAFQLTTCSFAREIDPLLLIQSPLPCKGSNPVVRSLKA